MTDTNRPWLTAHPQVKSLRIAACDLNGLPRGKRIPSSHASKAFDGQLRMPLSTLNVDIWGQDIYDSPLVFETGDADGSLIPTARGLVPMTWFSTPSALLPMWMYHDSGQIFNGDPRHALKTVLDRYSALGLTPVVATEMEFHLLDGKAREPTPPLSPLTGQTLASRDVLSINGLDAFDEFFTDLYDACEAMDIPADAAISESGLGQFEINLQHSADAMKAADDAWLFKLALRGVARKHGFAASFMAKPFPDDAGNGMHMHFSVLDRQGDNIFNDGTPLGSDMLRHAVGGCLKAMQASTLVFAPHFNSYRRHENNSHAPTLVCWGYENRTTAIRIPGGSPQARRIEHRVSGGDANPYLMLAVILGAALVGIEDTLDPGHPVKGNSYEAEAPELPPDWESAVDLFETDQTIKRIFHHNLIRNLVLCKRQEISGFINQPTEFEYSTYLETV